MSTPNDSSNGATLHINDADFQKQVLESELPVVVDFWAPWCPPCKRISPVLDKLAAEYKGRLVVAKIDVEQNQGQANQLGIGSIPALLYFKGGKLVTKRVGAASETELRRTFDELLAPKK